MGMMCHQTAGNDVLNRPSLRGTKQSSSLIIMKLQNNVIGNGYDVPSNSRKWRFESPVIASLRSNPESTIMRCFSLDCFVPRNDGWAGRHW